MGRFAVAEGEILLEQKGTSTVEENEYAAVKKY